MEEYIEKPVDILIEWRRWTVGIAWELLKGEDFKRLEISIQIPVVAVSIVYYF